MAKKALIYLIYQDLSTAVSGLASKVFLGRPTNISDDLSNLIAIELPVNIYPEVKGSLDVMAKSYGVFYVYSKAKQDGTLNVGAHTDLVQKVQDVFPIAGTHITASEPRILMEGNDGTGYQVTKLTFRIRTKFNARDIVSNN